MTFTDCTKHCKTILATHLVVASDPVLVDGNVFGVQELAAGAVLAWNTKEMLE